MRPDLFLFAWLALITALAFFLFGLDKRRARAGQWRVSERALFLCALLGGSFGALLGMLVFRHKTQHKSFTIGLPLILLAQLLLALLLATRGG